MIMRRMVGESSTTRMVLICGDLSSGVTGSGRTNVRGGPEGSQGPDGHGRTLYRVSATYLVWLRTPRMQSAPGERECSPGADCSRSRSIADAHPGASDRYQLLVTSVVPGTSVVATAPP